MKSKKLLLGMLVLVLVFGMTVVGCDDGSKDDGGSDSTDWSAWQTVQSGQSNQQGGWLLSFTGEFSRDSVLVEVQNGTPARFSVYKGQTHHANAPNSQISFRYSPSSITYIVSGTVRLRD